MGIRTFARHAADRANDHSTDGDRHTTVLDPERDKTVGEEGTARCRR
jgi:hypothetical protein